jgi:phosphotransferase system HPr (HPr) family protein
MSAGPVGTESHGAVRGANQAASESVGAPAAQESQDAMSGETLQRQVTITNPHGFHMRPAAAFAKLAARYQSTVTVSKDAVRVNGKSLLELFLLVALPGTQVTLEVSGPDARPALDALAAILAAPSPDDLPPDPSLPPKG